jgi:hypothetical protein
VWIIDLACSTRAAPFIDATCFLIRAMAAVNARWLTCNEGLLQGSVNSSDL